jgi:hypothetical protein
MGNVSQKFNFEARLASLEKDQENISERLTGIEEKLEKITEYTGEIRDKFNREEGATIAKRKYINALKWTIGIMIAFFATDLGWHIIKRLGGIFT